MSDENNKLDTDSLRMLINAVNTYIEELHESFTFLAQAAEVCQEAMGSDELSRKQIERMYDALEGLRVVALTAQEVAQNLYQDLMNAEGVYNA